MRVAGILQGRLATSLTGLADAVRSANAAVNPGYYVEVVVETLIDGSFQAVVRTVYEKTRDLLSSEAAKAINLWNYCDAHL